MKREFLFFEWVLVDNCNLFCTYCVNKGEFSHKNNEQIRYVPGREMEIAAKIVELSGYANQVTVNLTGGEPLLSEHFVEVLSLLAGAGNIRINLISNLKLIERFADHILEIVPTMPILGSLHVHFRSDAQIDRLIDFVNSYKGRLQINLSQVNHDLSATDREKLRRISDQTGMEITYQTFIPPWTVEGKMENSQSVSDANFVTSIGKRCCLGYSHFFIFPDGTFYFDQWCDEKIRKTGDFLAIDTDNFSRYIADDMKKCSKSSCGCNYNVFNYPEYLAACSRHGYAEEEIFGPDNLRQRSGAIQEKSTITERFKRWVVDLFPH